MAFCNSCGADVSGVKFCSKCGQPVEESPGAYTAPAEAAAAPAAAANDNVLGAVAYITLIPAIIFLLIEPYNKNRFIRFHSLQCLLLGATGLVLGITNTILSLVIGFIPVIGWILSILLSFGIMFAMLGAWLIAIIKAYNGEEYRLPLIGDMAAKHV